MEVNPIPEGFHTVTPYLIVHGAASLSDFLKQAFGAEEIFRMDRPDGSIMHAQMRIGDSMIELAEASDRFPARPATIHLYVSDADATYRQALEAGATSLMEPADQFYGDREAGVEDRSGNHWFIATHMRNVSVDELAQGEASLTESQAA